MIPNDILALINKGLTQSKPDYEITVPESAKTLEYLQHRATGSKIDDHLQSKGPCVLDLTLLVKQGGIKNAAKLRAIVANSPEGTLPFDRLFREGMCLPMVRSKDPRDYDLLFFVDQSILATYLNLCEGKAHLDLSTSKEITQKLQRHGFDPPINNVKYLVKGLSRDLRQLLYGDSSQPDLRVFETLFAVPKPLPTKEKGEERSAGSARPTTSSQSASISDIPI